MFQVCCLALCDHHIYCCKHDFCCPFPSLCPTRGTRVSSPSGASSSCPHGHVSRGSSQSPSTRVMTFISLSSLRNSSPTAKLIIPCCYLSPLLLVLFTVRTENRLFPSALEQPSTYLKTVIKFPFQSLLSQKHKQCCPQHRSNLDLKFPLL